MAGSVRYEERCLQQLARVLEFMLCEIPGRLTPVQELCEKASELTGGALKLVFQSCAKKIGQRAGQDILAIMDSAMDARLPPSCQVFLRELGSILGAFDADEQVEALESLSKRVSAELSELRQGKADRCRSYEVLGVCAGCALAILLL